MKNTQFLANKSLTSPTRWLVRLCYPARTAVLPFNCSDCANYISLHCQFVILKVAVHRFGHVIK